MASEWRHYIDIERHLDTIDAMVQRSTDMVNSSRRAVAELQERGTSTRERLAASWALLTKHANALVKKSTVPEKQPTSPRSP